MLTTVKVQRKVAEYREILKVIVKNELKSLKKPMKIIDYIKRSITWYLKSQK